MNFNQTNFQECFKQSSLFYLYPFNPRKNKKLKLNRSTFLTYFDRQSKQEVAVIRTGLKKNAFYRLDRMKYENYFIKDFKRGFNDAHQLLKTNNYQSSLYFTRSHNLFGEQINIFPNLYFQIYVEKMLKTLKDRELSSVKQAQYRLWDLSFRNSIFKSAVSLYLRDRSRGVNFVLSKIYYYKVKFLSLANARIVRLPRLYFKRIIYAGLIWIFPKKLRPRFRALLQSYDILLKFLTRELNNSNLINLESAKRAIQYIVLHKHLHKRVFSGLEKRNIRFRRNNQFLYTFNKSLKLKLNRYIKKYFFAIKVRIYNDLNTRNKINAMRLQLKRNSLLPMMPFLKKNDKILMIPFVGRIKLQKFKNYKSLYDVILLKCFFIFMKRRSVQLFDINFKNRLSNKALKWFLDKNKISLNQSFFIKKLLKYTFTTNSRHFFINCYKTKHKYNNIKSKKYNPRRIAQFIYAHDDIFKPWYGDQFIPQGLLETSTENHFHSVTLNKKYLDLIKSIRVNS